MYQIVLRWKTQVIAHVQYMLRTGCSWNLQSSAVCLQQLWLVDRVGSGAEREIVIKWFLNGNDSEYIRVALGGISHNCNAYQIKDFTPIKAYLMSTNFNRNN